MSSERGASAVCRWPLIVLAAAMLSGCGQGDGDKAVQKALRFYCAAGMRPPASEIAAAFEKARGVKVEMDFAGSEVLLSRIKLSGRGDLYMPGDARYVELARGENLILSDRPVCYFVPVILVRKGNPKGIRDLKDLLKPGIKVGLGDPRTCAVGLKASEIFRANGIAEPDVDKNVAYRSATVDELGVHIKTGSLDAVIVWDATAAMYEDCAEAVRIPRDRNVVSTVPIAVLASAKEKALAEQFAEFACSEEGKAILRRHRYTVDLSK